MKAAKMYKDISILALKAKLSSHIFIKKRILMKE